MWLLWLVGARGCQPPPSPSPTPHHHPHRRLPWHPPPCRCRLPIVVPSLSSCHCPAVIIVVPSSLSSHPRLPVVVVVILLSSCSWCHSPPGLVINTVSTCNPPHEQLLVVVVLGAVMVLVLAIPLPSSFPCRPLPPLGPRLCPHPCPCRCSPHCLVIPSSPRPHPAAPCFHPVSSGSQAWLGRCAGAGGRSGGACPVIIPSSCHPPSCSPISTP